MSSTFSYSASTKLCKYNSPTVTYQQKLTESNLCLAKIQELSNSSGQSCSTVAIENTNIFAKNIHSLLMSFLGLELTIVIAVCTMKLLKQLRPM